MRLAQDPFTITIDVEEYEGDSSRVEYIMDSVLDLCETSNVQITAFVVGELAVKYPKLIQRIANGGHEIALHGINHQTIDKWAPKDFISECKSTCSRLSDLAGQKIHGFRAPLFSMNPDTSWLPDGLSECGFSYSSSVVPIKQLRSGTSYPGAPKTAFLWPSGLVELPAATAWGLPVGGAYLRLFPKVLVKRMIHHLPKIAPWIYLHPYDFDCDEPFRVLPGTSGQIESRVLFFRRKVMKSCLQEFLKNNIGPPLIEVVKSLRLADLTTFTG